MPNTQSKSFPTTQEGAMPIIPVSDWSKFDQLSAEYALWPLWKKLAALSVIAFSAVAIVVMPYLTGQLTLGKERLGLTWTITFGRPLPLDSNGDGSRSGTSFHVLRACLGILLSSASAHD
jgi:hypothetical protein